MAKLQLNAKPEPHASPAPSSPTALALGELGDGPNSLITCGSLNQTLTDTGMRGKTHPLTPAFPPTWQEPRDAGRANPCHAAGGDGYLQDARLYPRSAKVVR